MHRNKYLRSGRVFVVSPPTSDRPDDGLVNWPSTDSFHHRQMLQVIVRLEESVASEEFDKYTSYTPNIAWETPPHVEYDFGRSIVSRRNDRRVVLIIERGGTKVDQPDFGTEQYSSKFCRSSRGL